MLSESYFGGYCQEKNQKFTGLNIQDDQWLEELGEMMAAAAEGIRRDQAFTARANARLSAA